ncbi:hypothetical protein WD019_19205 [Fictibacillus sp. Mic-4]|uniref:hypothetical protein n=1 Tax=Fictibacillus sp. Mic-4 TaxID=3132826 RepID=UPI003CEE6623
MLTFLLSVVVVFLLIPILYVLPLGKRKRDKWVLFGLAALVSWMGLLVKNYVPLWLTLLLMPGLAFIVTFIFERWMFSSDEAEEDDIEAIYFPPIKEEPDRFIESLANQEEPYKTMESEDSSNPTNAYLIREDERKLTDEWEDISEFNFLSRKHVANSEPSSNDKDIEQEIIDPGPSNWFDKLQKMEVEERFAKE